MTSRTSGSWPCLCPQCLANRGHEAITSSVMGRAGAWHSRGSGCHHQQHKTPPMKMRIEVENKRKWFCVCVGEQLACFVPAGFVFPVHSCAAGTSKSRGVCVWGGGRRGCSAEQRWVTQSLEMSRGEQKLGPFLLPGRLAFQNLVVGWLDPPGCIWSIFNYPVKLFLRPRLMLALVVLSLGK